MPQPSVQIRDPFTGALIDDERSDTRRHLVAAIANDTISIGMALSMDIGTSSVTANPRGLKVERAVSSGDNRYVDGIYEGRAGQAPVPVDVTSARFQTLLQTNAGGTASSTTVGLAGMSALAGDAIHMVDRGPAKARVASDATTVIDMGAILIPTGTDGVLGIAADITTGATPRIRATAPLGTGVTGTPFALSVLIL